MRHFSFSTLVTWSRRLAPAILIAAAGASPIAAAHAADVHATGLERPFGSTVGPGGDIYVADAAAGQIVRVDPRTGATSVYADGLPVSVLIGVIGVGGAMDVTFVGGVAYALVTLVGWPFDGSGDVSGIYRLEASGDWTAIADIGTYSLNNPPPEFDAPTGLQYAIQEFRNGFLVTDGNHNRVLYVTHDGAITQLIQFGNVVPTGLEVHGNDVYLALAGPVPHDPADGEVLRLDPKNWQTTTEVASGSPLLVDVERGRGTQLLALSQGAGIEGAPAGAPAVPDSGALVSLDGAGGFTVIEAGINLPTSMTIIRNTAYIVSLDGKVYRVPTVSAPPFGQ